LLSRILLGRDDVAFDPATDEVGFRRQCPDILSIQDRHEKDGLESGRFRVLDYAGEKSITWFRKDPISHGNRCVPEGPAFTILYFQDVVYMS